MHHRGKRGDPVRQVPGLSDRRVRRRREVKSAVGFPPIPSSPSCVLANQCFRSPRLNEAPVFGYSKDVGSKTTLRITYPEGAIQKPEGYEKDSLFVFSAFKPLDFKWLKQMVFKEKLVRIV